MARHLRRWAVGAWLCGVLATEGCAPEPGDDDDAAADDDAVSDDDASPDDDAAGVVEGGPGPVDGDGDGHPWASDCDDADPWTAPGAREVCGDDVDQDCDGDAPPCRHQGIVTLDHADGSADAVLATPDRDLPGVTEPFGFAGDLDGDGHDDLVIGDLGQDRLCIVYAPIEGYVDLQAEPERCGTEVLGDFYQPEVRPVGDGDGDGYGELLIGNDVARPSGLVDAGAVHLLRGPLPESVDLRVEPAIVEGTSEHEDVGTSVAAGDVDGDGLTDFLVGASGYVSGAYLVYGPVLEPRTAATVDAFFDANDLSGWLGHSVDLGDLDGDGRADLVIGAPYADLGPEPSSGAVLVYYGPRSGVVLPEEADAVLIGEEDSGAGGRVAVIPPQPRDPYAQLLIGAHGTSETDASRAYLAPAPWVGSASVADVCFRLWGRPYWTLGGDLAPIGDWNGDQWADIALRDHSSWEERSAVYVLSGPFAADLDAPSQALLALEGAVDAEVDAGAYRLHFERSNGDHDGDGYADVLVGASGYDFTASPECASDATTYPTQGCDEGAAFLYRGGAVH